ncbi:tubulin-tyrosine ligase family protein [Stylonychia lemnae]|uniref:Tubulin--tyrosine ligase-like protein 5 n=1 Tax=Stylonychia lemnae TaxID=5949 RepID=A0A078AAN3_STYLE|nr:tubulin-tyrosine ligase family protein [Stylonychia lemnae]|eukprot:CDW78896.1 tubulin-tyrosine ligase family protein [Stylonychia lemnae]
MISLQTDTKYGNLIRLNKRPQYNNNNNSQQSPYLQLQSRVLNQKSTLRLQPTDYPVLTQQEYQTFDGDATRRNQILKFNTNMIQTQIKRQKQQRKNSQYKLDQTIQKLEEDQKIEKLRSQQSQSILEREIQEFQKQILREDQELEQRQFNRILSSKKLEKISGIQQKQPKTRIKQLTTASSNNHNTIQPRQSFNTDAHERKLTKVYGMSHVSKHGLEFANIKQERSSSVIDHNLMMQQQQQQDSPNGGHSQTPKIQIENNINLENLREFYVPKVLQRGSIHINNQLSRDNISKSTQNSSIAQLLNIQQDKLNLQTIDQDDQELEKTFMTKDQEKFPAVQKTIKDKTKYLDFRPFKNDLNAVLQKYPDRGYFFKFFNPQTDIKLIRYTFEDNGFREFTNHRGQNSSFSLANNHQNSSFISTTGGKRDESTSNICIVIWSCQIMKSSVYQALNKRQKINHFPRSYELTRKDFMNERIVRMAQLFGRRNFNFTPITYVLPKEVDLLQREMDANRRQWWIIKPSASAQGKGIYITNNFSEIQTRQNIVASHYIDSPLLINNLKFDLRIYVGITSINPLRIYIYEEGLTRFATCKYEQIQFQTKQNRFMHLTNYSVNKFNKNAFVQNDKSTDQAFGSKWSISSLRKVLKELDIDDTEVFRKIEDIIIKTIISAEPILNNAFEMYVPYRNNCFELLGFDILIDSMLNPWLLEVNLSPSLACDSSLDQEIKGQLVADLLNLAGVMNVDFKPAKNEMINELNTYTKGSFEYQISHNKINSKKNKVKQKLNASMFQDSFTADLIPRNRDILNQYKGKDKVILREAEEEYYRKGKFKLIFPTDNFGFYKSFFEEERQLNVQLDKYFRQMGIIGARKNV